MLNDQLGENQNILQNIFNDDMFNDEEPNDVDSEENNKKATEDFSKMLPPEEQQKHFLTEKDQRIKKKDIPERLQIRFEGRSEANNEEMVHEARWIVRKLIIKNNLADQFSEFLEVKVYGVLENLLWKNQEIMYIWMYSRQDITSNMHSNNRIEHNYELTLEDLWFIYFADEEWQKCSELKLSLTKLMKLLDKYEKLQGLAKVAFDNAMDLEHLTACYEFMRFRLKCYIDEDEIEELLESNTKSGKGKQDIHY
jgi:transcription elongation factor SPT6